jgi:hypothetical protein
MTTGKAAQALPGQAKGDRTLITPEVRDWLERVVQAATKRNETMHAVARDQCLLCGDATRFEHRNRPVDRSAAAVEAVSAKFRDLIDDGIRHAAATRIQNTHPGSSLLSHGGGRGVLTVQDWAEIRRLHRAEEMPIKAIARLLGVSRNTVQAAIASDARRGISGNLRGRWWIGSSPGSGSCCGRIPRCRRR